MRTSDAHDNERFATNDLASDLIVQGNRDQDDWAVQVVNARAGNPGYVSSRVVTGPAIVLFYDSLRQSHAHVNPDMFVWRKMGNSVASGWFSERGGDGNSANNTPPSPRIETSSLLLPSRSPKELPVISGLPPHPPKETPLIQITVVVPGEGASFGDDGVKSAPEPDAEQKLQPQPQPHTDTTPSVCVNVPEASPEKSVAQSQSEPVANGEPVSAPEPEAVTEPVSASEPEAAREPQAATEPQAAKEPPTKRSKKQPTQKTRELAGGGYQTRARTGVRKANSRYLE